MDRRDFIERWALVHCLANAPWGIRATESLPQLTAGPARAPKRPFGPENPFMQLYLSAANRGREINDRPEYTMMHFAYARAQIGNGQAPDP